MGFISSIFGYVLNFIYNFVNNYGLAMILFTVVLRIILIPITIKQQRTMQKSSKIQGKMKEIQKKYKNNPEKLNQETMDLYKKEKMSPFSGCLSAILQLVIILAVFYLVSQPLTYMKKIDKNIIENYKTELKEQGQEMGAYPEIRVINKKGSEDPNVFINMEFLGLDLSKVPTESLTDWTVYIIPVCYILSSFFSIRMTTKMQGASKKKLTLNEEGEPEVDDQAAAMEQMNKSMSYMMPIMSITIAFIAPLGLALYWFVGNVFMILERVVINKFMIAKEEENDAE